jgi:hypothetical protein
VVAHHGDLFGAEHLDVLGADLPTGKEAPDQGVHVQPDVSIAQPAHDPPEGVVIEVAEGPRGHAVAEVVAPAPQCRLSRRSRSASVRCLALRVSVRTLSMIDASVFFDG